jgi:hypothetical protein
MIKLLKKGIQILNEELAQHEQLRVNAENEYQAMSCGAFNPRFLAKIKRSKADNNTKYEKKHTPVSDGAVSAN